jgi:hypothetical protein
VRHALLQIEGGFNDLAETFAPADPEGKTQTERDMWTTS